MDGLRDRKRIGVIGTGDAEPEAMLVAEAVGRCIARAGALLVCGGRGGVMEAAARGARAAGGLTIGILPGDSTAEANPHIDLAIATGLGHTRNSLVALNADALVAIAGNFGTLSEIAFAGIYGRRVVGLGSWAVDGIVPARDAEEAVRLALEAC